MSRLTTGYPAARPGIMPADMPIHLVQSGASPILFVGDCDAAVLVRRHLAGFRERLEESGHGPLPEFVRAELEGFAGCGDFARGFVRTACRTSGGDELRVPFALPACSGSPSPLRGFRGVRTS